MDKLIIKIINKSGKNKEEKYVFSGEEAGKQAEKMLNEKYFSRRNSNEQ